MEISSKENIFAYLKKLKDELLPSTLDSSFKKPANS
jgi:hypothetical protein